MSLYQKVHKEIGPDSLSEIVMAGNCSKINCILLKEYYVLHTVKIENIIFVVRYMSFHTFLCKKK